MKPFEPDNRLDYGRILMPEEGWATSWAIGTTFGLNLEVLMTVPLALFHGKYLSEKTDLSNLRLDMLDSLDKVRDRMFVFTHEDNVSADIAFSMLLSYLDQNIWNIRTERVDQSFHPKVWLVRYEKGKDYCYRLVVMSRNITTATDFDMAIKLEGFRTTQNMANDSLVEFMDYLMERTGKDKVMSQYRSELKNIKFYAPGQFQQKVVFWPQGQDDWKCPIVQDEHDYQDLMVISPFADEGALSNLRSRLIEGKTPVLVSREEEMDKIDPEELKKWRCYKWNPMLDQAGDYEENEDIKNTFSRSIGLHAKVYIIRAAFKGQQKVWNNWFVGSTNCTGAGFYSNIEAMTQIYGESEGTSAEDVLATLLNPDAPLICDYEIKDEKIKDTDEQEKQKTRKLIHALSHLSISGKAVPVDKERYVVSAEIDEERWKAFVTDYIEATVKVSMFADQNDTWELMCSPKHEFKPVYCQQLSPFVRVEICYGEQKKSFLLKMDMIIPSERSTRIMAEILDTDEKLMKYLLFCLDHNMNIEDQKIGKDTKSSRWHGSQDSAWSSYYLPIYERLLIASSRHPESLTEIKKNVERLKGAKGKDGKNLLSKEFLNMWELFKPYAK